MSQTIGDLLLAESHAAFLEQLHQSVCRQRAAGLDCQSCLDHEATWLAADTALERFQRAAREAVAV